MDARFARELEPLHSGYERLVAMAPIAGMDKVKPPPIRGVYLFSEGGKHLYVGRSNNVRSRFDAHMLPGSPQYSAAFAVLLAREETGRKSNYRAGPDSRKSLAVDFEFNDVFRRQKERVRKMEFRYVEENRAITQMLLEVYCALVLETRYNDFDNH